MTSNLLNHLKGYQQQQKKGFAVLIDPGKTTLVSLDILLNELIQYPVDFIFIGGSLLVENHMTECIQKIKEYTDIPVLIFPGDTYQISDLADGILFLSLISSRNPELLIGKHVIAAPYLKKSGLAVLPTGYMLIDGGRPNSASYMSHSFPIPADKPDIAACTALAGALLGLQLIYLDAGSGALQAISSSMIARVRAEIDLPIIVGGGIRTAEKAIELCKAGADLIVVGNAIEHNPKFIKEMSEAIQVLNHGISLV